MEREDSWALSIGAAILVLLATATVSGCGTPASHASGQAAVKTTAGKAQLQMICAKDAKSVALPADFPATAALPEGYLVTAVDRRSDHRIVVSAVSPKPFKATLKDMQATYSVNGLKLSEGEVEEADAESGFSGKGITGRWAIRAIPRCHGNTGVSLVTGKTGS